MLNKTQGIVLHTINYNDRYMLVRIYTKDYGSISYMVAKTRNRKSKVPRSLFAPLALIELDVEHLKTREIQRIREARPLIHFYSIATDMNKTSMAFFISEFLTRILQDTDDVGHTFDFLSQSIEILEEKKTSVANYHMVLMLKLSRILGFYPNLEDYNRNDIFDMMNGVFVGIQPLHKHYVGREESTELARLARINYENMHKFKFNRQERNNIIERMLEYYRLHLHDFPRLKSLDVLKELF